MYTVERYHDISAGHRVYGHESKCRFLHGHNYRVHFTCAPMDALDNIGRVVDFGVIKAKLCMWLEDNWDHKFLLWQNDPLVPVLLHTSGDLEEDAVFRESVVTVPFNPTAEAMAAYLVNTVGPRELLGLGIILHEVRIEETRKCAASYTRVKDHMFYIAQSKNSCGFTESVEGHDPVRCLRLPNHRGAHNMRGEPA